MDRDRTEMGYTLQSRLLRWSIYVLRAGLPQVRLKIQEAIGKPLSMAITMRRMVSDGSLALVTHI